MANTTLDPGAISSLTLHISHQAGCTGPSAQTQTRPAADKVAGSCTARRILIVDDDPEILKLVSRMIGILGSSTHTADDALGALFQLEKIPVDLVLTDYKMPFFDGYQLAVEIKRKWPETKVVIMTGHCEPDITDMLTGSDVVDGLLLKPFNLQDLEAQLACAVSVPLTG
jgi:CheY-like chemotaxis protein